MTAPEAPRKPGRPKLPGGAKTTAERRRAHDARAAVIVKVPLDADRAEGLALVRHHLGTASDAETMRLALDRLVHNVAERLRGEPDPRAEIIAAGRESVAK